jgi:peptidoglycan/LPS O-acetylase OafA/YrhL
MAAPEPTGQQLNRVLPKGARLHSLDLLRAFASLAVFYVHLSAWFRYHGGPTSVTNWLQRWVVEPAHLNKDFGFLGVALFFLVSGFVISAVAMRESVAEFGIKRAVRLFPTLAAAALLSWVLVVTGYHRIPGGTTDVDLADLLLNSVLANFFVPGSAALVGVAWTLIIQLAIYAMVCALLPLYRREPWLVIGIEITVCAVVLSVVRNFQGLPNSTIANIGAFGTAVILGQVVWAVWARRLPLWAGAGLGLGCWVVFLWGDALGYARFDDSYPLTLFIALLVMVLAVLAGERVRPNRVVSWLSSRSYSTYLVHQTVAFSVLLATQTWNRWLAGLAAIGCTFLVVEILHRTVERPVGRLIPALLAKKRRTRDHRRPPTPPPADPASLATATSGAPG